MKNVVITILAILVLGLGGYLVYDKVIDKKESINTDVENNDTETKTKEEVKYKIVKSYTGTYTDKETCTGEYNETFNNTNVKITYNGCAFDDFKYELIVNGEKVKLSVPILEEFAFYGNYLIFTVSSTGFKGLDIYDVDDKKMAYSSLDSGYWNEGYTMEENKIVFTGRECGEQCGLKSSEYKYAKFEFEYENGKLKDPVIVEKWN